MNSSPERANEPEISDEVRGALAIIAGVFGDGIVQITHKLPDGTEQTLPFELSKYTDTTASE